MKDFMGSNAIWHHEMIYLKIPSNLSTIYKWYSSEINKESMTHGWLTSSIYRQRRSPRVSVDDLNAFSLMKQIWHERDPCSQIIIKTYPLHGRSPRAQIIITQSQQGRSPFVWPLLILNLMSMHVHNMITIIRVQ